MTSACKRRAALLGGLLMLGACGTTAGAKGAAPNDTKLDASSQSLRDKLYSATLRTEVGGPDVRPHEVYGVIVEIGVEGTVAIVAGYKDGTARLILGKGGSVVVRKEDLANDTRILARNLVTHGQGLLHQILPEKERTLPRQNEARVVFLTGGGVYVEERTVKNLDDVRADLAELWGTTNHLMASLQNQSPAR